MKLEENLELINNSKKLTIENLKLSYDLTDKVYNGYYFYNIPVEKSEDLFADYWGIV